VYGRPGVGTRERDEPMALWQMAKVVTGVDDHSRYCVIASVVSRATGRAVCLAFASALREFGVPDEHATGTRSEVEVRKPGAPGRIRTPRPAA
jgi:hypothetical protein